MLCKIVFFFAISAATTTSVWGLQCYNCIGPLQAGCAAPFNATLFTPQNCTAGFDACITSTVTVANVSSTTRACATTAAGEPCDLVRNATVGTLNGTVNSCYSCKSDLCNTSSSLQSALALVVLLCVFQFVFTKL